MRPEMPPGLFKKIIFHRQLANLALQLDDLASVLHRRQTNASPSNSRKRQFPLGAPLRAPAIQQFRTQLIFARSLTGTSSGSPLCALRRSSDRDCKPFGPNPFLSPFNVFG